MSLTVGTDTYISYTDAVTYLQAHYMTNDTKLMEWSKLIQADCEVLLRRAAKIIDRLAIIGIKASSTQTMAFPRAIHSDGYQSPDYYNPIDIYGDDWYVQTSVPDAVKYAQCEIAIDLVEGPSDRAKLQQQGVKSFSLDGLSETYTGSFKSIISNEASELLGAYLGGYRI